jgi:signal transduction histidine kinase
MAVTLSALVVVVAAFGLLFFSFVLEPNDILAPEFWIETLNTKSATIIGALLAQDPVNRGELAKYLSDADATLSEVDLFRIGNSRLYLKTTAEFETLIVGTDGILWAATRNLSLGELSIGDPLDRSLIPGLDGPLQAALAGEQDPDRLSSTEAPGYELIVAVPLFDYVENDLHIFERQVNGAIVVLFKSLPTESDIPVHTMQLISKSLLIFLLAAGSLAAIFGSLTARNLARRFERLAQAADSWSQGDFAQVVDDPSRDELGQLADRLNSMAEQLKSLIVERQDIAVFEERNRLARELHDSVKQQAFAASFQLSSAASVIDQDPQNARDYLLEAEKLVDTVRQELTELVHELRPPNMKARDLEQTLNDYAIEWAHREEIEVDVQYNCPEELPLDVKQTLFRILQESLANISKHSQADHVNIRFDCESGLGTMSISDNGDGFDPSLPHPGMGLHSMRERAESINGLLDIESVSDQGTTVSVKFHPEQA